jgi:hypothetical protein
MSMNSHNAETIPFVPAGYPLSYFANTEPFATWLRHGRAQSRNMASGIMQAPRPRPDAPTRPPEWTEHVRLELFTSRRLYPYGPYEHIVEFTATKMIAISLPEPKGTIALFGKEVKKDEPPPRLRLRFIVEAKYGHLDRLEISGAVRFQLPHSLVRPVFERDGRWVAALKRHVVLPLGGSTLTLRRGARPKLSAPLAAPAVAVQLARTGLVVSLASAVVDIAGSPARPKLQFQKVRLVYLHH